MRFRLYREHKLVTARLNEFDKFIGTVDFRKDAQIQVVQTKFLEIKTLMEAHAAHENNDIHPLLKSKGSEITQQIETEHRTFTDEFSNLTAQLDVMVRTLDLNKRTEQGYFFLLMVREYIKETLAHLNEEERIIMPELWRLCTDEELKEVDNPVYREMTIFDIVHMLSDLFPYFNYDDHLQFLLQIQEVRNNTDFLRIWFDILKDPLAIPSQAEREELAKELHVPIPNIKNDDTESFLNLGGSRLGYGAMFSDKKENTINLPDTADTTETAKTSINCCIS